MVQQFQNAIKDAMKNKNQALVTVLRAVSNDANMAAKNTNRAVTNDDYMSAIQKGIKTRDESYKIYVDANRTDLAENEKYEIDVLKSFLPTAMSEDELKTTISKIIADLGVTSKKEMGKVMGAIVSTIPAGTYDKAQASKLVGSLLV